MTILAVGTTAEEV